MCEPLGPENKLILAPGLMSGSAATTSGRISVGCKSPLTGGIKEANAGGQASQYLARLGYAAVVLTEKGQLLGSGTATVAKHYGVERAPVVKGQSIAAYDPRSLKGMGVTYATSTMGADHTAGFTLGNHLFGLEPTSDPLDGENQLLPSAVVQISAAAFDSTGGPGLPARMIACRNG